MPAEPERPTIDEARRDEARRALLTPLAFELRDGLVRSGIATPEQGERLITALCEITVERLGREAEASMVEQAQRLAERKWWEFWK
jgi:hypothetical protein